MKIHFKKISLLLIGILLAIITLAGCGSSNDPEEVVNDLLSTVKKGKLDKIDKYLVDGNGPSIDKQTRDTIDKKIEKYMYKKYDFEKPEVVHLDQYTAQVAVKITSIDMGVITGQAIAEVTPHALEHADDEKQIQKQAKKVMLKKLKDKHAPMITRTVYLELEKDSKGDWKVVVNRELLDALYGGI